MGSRKEEERNEKIIRGLMKLPPNRRCINCNSLGPQYVCTTFWTFVCTTCSGIHREFTHRVKSVSMAKFTSQEVEALENGGNQRAREIFLKGWDTQTQRFPDNSNAEKIRIFIKNVYIDKAYYAPKSTDKPPRHLQNSRSLEEETRRASSYHSYSQSPPYDFQYEEHRYGKHAPALSRKPGSDRGLYEGKFSSFSSPRMSDYSVSGGADHFRPDTQSPNYEKDVGSPFNQTSRDVSTENLQHYTGKYDVKTSHPQRTASAGSFGSFDSLSYKSESSVGVVEISSESERSMETHHQQSISETSHDLNLFTTPFVPHSVGSFGSRSHLPESTSIPSVDLFQHSPNLIAPTFSAHQFAENTAASSLDLFSEMPSKLPAATVDGNSQGKVILPNEGWATFDSQTVESSVKKASVALPSSEGNSAGNFEPLPLAPWSSFEEPAAVKRPSEPSVEKEGPRIVRSISNPVSSQWPSLTEFSAVGDSSSSPSVWNQNQQIIEAPSNKMETQPWNAFEDSTGQLNSLSTQTSNANHETQTPLVVDNHMEFGLPEDFTGEFTQNETMSGGSLSSGISSHVRVPIEDLSMPVEGTYAMDHKPTNPFDLPYDSSLESKDMSQFWDMSSLQAALPDAQMPASLSGDDLTQPWYNPGPMAQYVPSEPQGALGFIAAQAQSSQIPNVHLQGPVASIGGNPFA
ncbi:hypothetical protein Leryth_024865 [Lithospermum erythrorhizon]|nr:hypothetical protein Leryth_024865 [Lithospermum erythrorhizon]